MRLTKIATGLAAVVLALGLTSAFAQEKKDDKAGDQKQAKTETKQEPKAAAAAKPLCPLMDEPVDYTVRTVTEDGPVYFCCEGCIEKYNKDPKKYAEKVTAQRAVLAKMERVQVSCPVGGEAVDGKTTKEIGGKSVAFCCKECVEKYEKEPAKYAGKLEAAYCYQTKCAVSGEKIDPKAFVDLPTKQRIYFCCTKCAGKFEAEPSKYAKKLAEMGITIDLKKVSEGKAGETKAKP